MDQKPTYEDALREAVYQSAKAVPAIQDRLDRLWRAVSNAEYASDTTPLEQYLSVINMLRHTGVGLPEIDTFEMYNQLLDRKGKSWKREQEALSRGSTTDRLTSRK